MQGSAVIDDYKNHDTQVRPEEVEKILDEALALLGPSPRHPRDAPFSMNDPKAVCDFDHVGNLIWRWKHFKKVPGEQPRDVFGA